MAAEESGFIFFVYVGDFLTAAGGSEVFDGGKLIDFSVIMLGVPRAS